MNNVISNRTQVNVGGQIYEIPSEKVGELLSLLANWQSISISEQSRQTQGQAPTWDGRQLLNG